MNDYSATRDRVESYFDGTATKVWARLTSDAPVSGVRATVREGRDRMRDLMLRQLPRDLTGLRILDAGCGTGAASVMMAERGAQVVAVDISPKLVAIAQERCPQAVRDRISFVAGDMLEATQGQFHHVFAMDSMIYYRPADVAALLGRMRGRVIDTVVFTLPPRTPLLMAMFRVGKLFPRADRSPQMVPQSTAQVAQALRDAAVPGKLKEIERINAGFYISTALTFEGGQ